MGWLKNLLQRPRSRGLGAGQAQPRETQSVDELISILRGEMDAGGIKRSLTDAEARAELTGWQYASIETIAAALMSASWRVEVRDADGWVDAPDHALARLLTEVNPFMTGAELTYWTTVEMLVTGRSWVLKVRNSLGEPAELWPLVGRVTPIVRQGEGLVGWKEEVSKGGAHRQIVHDARDIVYYRLPKIGDLWGGFGRLQAAGAAIRLGTQIDETEWSAFKRGIFPSLIAYIDEPDPQKREAIANELRERYSGSKESGALIGLHQVKAPDGSTRRRIDLDTIRPNTPRMMGFAEGRQEVRDRVLSVIRTPLALLGLSKDVNRASAVALEYIFAKWGVTPLVRMREARENQDLANEWEGTRIRYESIVPADRELDLRQQEVDIKTGVRTINEVRQERGLEPVPWGEVPWMPQGMLPVGTPPSEEGGQARAARPFRAEGGSNNASGTGPERI